MNDFESCLAGAIAGSTDPQAAAVQQVLDAPPSLRRTLLLNILEHRATLYLNDHHQPGPEYGTGAIDWAAVPWAEILTGLLKVLVILIPLLV